jgi:teichuronic acid biosynthesis glycosyltransferase TuaH
MSTARTVMQRRSDASGFGGQSWEGVIVMVSSTSWDDTWLGEKHLSRQLAKHVPVLYVDPPISVLSPLRKPQVRDSLSGPRLRMVGPNLARLTPVTAPGVTRPGLRELAEGVTRATIRRALRALGTSARAIVTATLDDVLTAAPGAVRVVQGKDDWVASGQLIGVSTNWLRRRESRQLAMANLVTCVSETLAERWRSEAQRVIVLPNGCDTEHFATTDAAPAASDVTLARPIVGFIGHLSERIELGLLERVADTGTSLLLVGPRQLTFDLARVDSLISRPNVQWMGPRPFERLPEYMRMIDVGLTPYADTPFNRASDPLKTLEYLAAGVPVVATSLPSAERLPAGLVGVARDADEFVALTLAALRRDRHQGAAARREYAARQSWASRAEQFLVALAAVEADLGRP